MDTTTLVIVIAAVVIVAVVAAGAFVVMRRRSARRAYRPVTSYREDRTFVGIGAPTPPVSDATMVGPMAARPAAPRSEATVVDVRAATPPPPPTAPPAVAPAAASEAPTVVMPGRQAEEEAIAPTIRIPKLRARLTVTKGGSGTHELEAREYSIGRSSRADIVLADPSVSGHHAKLTVHGDAFAVVDLGSTNGTTVDGQPLQGSYVLRGGETIGFGEARARYEKVG